MLKRINLTFTAPIRERIDADPKFARSRALHRAMNLPSQIVSFYLLRYGGLTFDAFSLKEWRETIDDATFGEDVKRATRIGSLIRERSKDDQSHVACIVMLYDRASTHPFVTYHFYFEQQEGELIHFSAEYPKVAKK